MQPTNDPRLLLPAILISIGLIIASVFFANKLLVGEMKDSLTRIVVLILVMLVVLWIIDKLVFMNRNLLTASQSDGLFSLISGLILTIFGVYFGSQSKEK